MSMDFVFDVLGGIVGAVLGFLSAIIYNYITKLLERREQKKLRDNNYLNLYNALKIYNDRVNTKIAGFISFRNAGLEKFSEDMNMLVNQFYTPEGNVTVNKPSAATIKIDDIRWILILSFNQHVIIDKKNDGKRFDYDRPDKSDREVLINFLEDLEHRYRKASVIKANQIIITESEKQEIRDFK